MKKLFFTLALLLAMLNTTYAKHTYTSGLIITSQNGGSLGVVCISKDCNKLLVTNTDPRRYDYNSNTKDFTRFHGIGKVVIVEEAKNLFQNMNEGDFKTLSLFESSNTAAKHFLNEASDNLPIALILTPIVLPFIYANCTLSTCNQNAVIIKNEILKGLNDLPLKLQELNSENKWEGKEISNKAMLNIQLCIKNS